MLHHKIKSVVPLNDFKLLVHFKEGITKIFDVSSLFDSYPMFKYFIDHPEEFFGVIVDVGDCGIIWNEDLDLDCTMLWDDGKTIETDFDGLLSFADAASLWGLNESTLRKAISYGKLKKDVDVCKYGKQWIVTSKAMNREYGPIRN